MRWELNEGKKWRKKSMRNSRKRANRAINTSTSYLSQRMCSRARLDTEQKGWWYVHSGKCEYWASLFPLVAQDNFVRLFLLLTPRNKSFPPETLKVSSKKTIFSSSQTREVQDRSGALIHQQTKETESLSVWTEQRINCQEKLEQVRAKIRRLIWGEMNREDKIRVEIDLSRVVRSRVKDEGYEVDDERRKGETKEGRKGERSGSERKT